jgi:hypothetical protein
VAQKRPQPAPLLDGQVAININAGEPGMFFKQSDGALTKVGPTCVNTTGFAPNSAPAGPGGNTVGELWLDGRSAFTSPLLKIWNGTQWLATSGFEIDDVTGDFTLGDKLYFKQDVFPHADNVVNLGSPSLRFANIYTGDLHLRNDRGDWTMVEEEDFLSLRNNKTGKTFRLVMEEVEN